MSSLTSSGICATGDKEAAPIQARHGRAAGDQEVPEVHRAAHPVRTLCPSGGCLCRPNSTLYPRFRVQSVMEAFVALQVKEITKFYTLKYPTDPTDPTNPTKEVDRWTPQALVSLQEVNSETCHLLLNESFFLRITVE